MYLSTQAGKFSKVPQSTVQLWTDKGLVNSSKTKGTGDRREYDEIECIQIGIVKSLRDKGLPLRTIEKVMKTLIPKKRLELHLKHDHSVLILRLDTDHIIKAPQKSVLSFSNDEVEANKKDLMGKWVYATWPSDCDEVRIVNLTRIATRILKQIEIFKKKK